MKRASDYGVRAMPFFPWGKKRELLRKAEAILEECCQQLDLKPKALGKTAKEWIFRRKWEEDPSDMRRMIYTAALVSPRPEIEAAHFPPRGRRDHEAFSKAQFEAMALEEAVRHKVAHFFKRLGGVEAADVHRAVVAQVERALFEESLNWAGGNQLKAARVLGIDRNTLRKKMRALGIAAKRQTRDSRLEIENLVTY